ncbi:MIP/aquaporin family protein [Jiangella mangrovi]|uniref:MIP family channel proteins n=1 Tax=Jiangella mangrovi TaxID=1524084 RepID=A0A7W9GR11_9ACTN|nr:aquaporin [Jiangella mangrovi]MBB5788450.1 MIP family channel proteins [Jiangella mangrovi]
MTDAWIRNAVAEAVGVFILVSATLLVFDAGATPRALAYGFVVVGLVVALGHVSGGHFNPAVTLAMLLDKKIDVLAAVAYWLAQFAGATLGAVAVMLTTDREIVELGTPVIASGMSVGGAIALEAIFTMAIVLVVFGAVVDDRAPLSAYPFGIGLTVAVGAFATDSLTGSALNPAKGFGPAVVSGQWDGLAAWLAGPVIGGILAWALYRFVIAPPGGSGSPFVQRRDRYPEPVPPPGPSLMP